MICADTTTRFRLLDGFVGWDPQKAPGSNSDLLACGVNGFDDERGLRLLYENEPQVSNDILTPWMPPPWITPGCQPCEWYLISSERENVPAPPFSCDHTYSLPILLRRTQCYPDWQNIFESHTCRDSVGDAVAVTVSRYGTAVLFKQTKRKPPELVVRSVRHNRLTGYTQLPVGCEPLDVACSPWCELIVSVTGVEDDALLAYGKKHFVEVTPAIANQASGSENQVLLGFDPSGRLRSITTVRTDHPFQRLAIATDGSLWAAAAPEPDSSHFHLWRIFPKRWISACSGNDGTDDKRAVSCLEPELFCAELITDAGTDVSQELDNCLVRTGLIAISKDGFCLEDPASSSDSKTRCFKRDGTPATRDEALPSAPITAPRLGQLLTQPLDSLVPRCRWHRVRVEAEVPDDTGFLIAVATSEQKLEPNDKPVEEGTPWDLFPAGSPHQFDWQEAPENATDFLIDQPAGRYLYVRIRLRGSETKTPVIHRVRIDFPRVTSLNQLPTVYRENDEAEDFTERFLSLFDATMQDVDRVIERLPSLVDAQHVPEEVLPWLGAFLGIAFHSSWTTEQRRELLQAAPQLYRQRGTRAGLVKAIELIFGVTPAIDESVFRTASGAIGVDTQLGAVRLFGKSRSRFRVGRSALGEAPLRSYGNPDHDPVREGAHRFRVMMPPDTNLNRLGRDHLDRLIASQKPAHTVHSLRVGGQGFILGRRSAVGIDTKLIPTAPPVLGGGKEPQNTPGNVYLSRSSVLRPGLRGRSLSLRVGITSSLGVHTVLE